VIRKYRLVTDMSWGRIAASASQSGSVGSDINSSMNRCSTVSTAPRK
jgi:hypothetical protein